MSVSDDVGADEADCEEGHDVEDELPRAGEEYPGLTACLPVDDEGSEVQVDHIVEQYF